MKGRCASWNRIQYLYHHHQDLLLLHHHHHASPSVSHWPVTAPSLQEPEKDPCLYSSQLNLGVLISTDFLTCYEPRFRFWDGIFSFSFPLAFLSLLLLLGLDSERGEQSPKASQLITTHQFTWVPLLQYSFPACYSLDVNCSLQTQGFEWFLSPAGGACWEAGKPLGGGA